MQAEPVTLASMVGALSLNRQQHPSAVQRQALDLQQEQAPVHSHFRPCWTQRGAAVGLPMLPHIGKVAVEVPGEKLSRYILGVSFLRAVELPMLFQSRQMATEKQGWHICRHFCRHRAQVPSAKANMYTGNGCQRRANCLSLEGLGRRDCVRSHQVWLIFTRDILAYRWQIAAESLAGECRAESETLQQLRQPGSLATADMAQSLVRDMAERAQQHGASAVSQELLQMVAEHCTEAGESRSFEQVLRVAKDVYFECCVLQACKIGSKGLL